MCSSRGGRRVSTRQAVGVCSSCKLKPIGTGPESRDGPYRGTSLIRNSHPLRIAIGPYAEADCRFQGKIGCTSTRYPCTQDASVWEDRGALAFSGIHTKGICTQSDAPTRSPSVFAISSQRRSLLKDAQNLCTSELTAPPQPHTQSAAASSDEHTSVSLLEHQHHASPLT